MEWALAIIFGIAALLLIYSFVKTNHEKKAEQRELDLLYISTTQEITKLQKQVQNLELAMGVNHQTRVAASSIDEGSKAANGN